MIGELDRAGYLPGIQCTGLGFNRIVNIYFDAFCLKTAEDAKNAEKKKKR